MSNNYAPCFNRFDIVVIHSYIELPWFTTKFLDSHHFPPIFFVWCITPTEKTPFFPNISSQVLQYEYFEETKPHKRNLEFSKKEFLPRAVTFSAVAVTVDFRFLFSAGWVTMDLSKSRQIEEKTRILTYFTHLYLLVCSYIWNYWNIFWTLEEYLAASETRWTLYYSSC